MITVYPDKKIFFLCTQSSTLLLRVLSIGKLVCEYYGKPIAPNENIEAFCRKSTTPRGRSIIYDAEKEPQLSLNDIAGEFSSPLRGDHNTPSLLLERPETMVFDFVYVSYEVRDYVKMEGYPNPHDCGQELVILLEDKIAQAELELHYVIFEKANVIGRYCKLINKGTSTITIRRFMSMQLCIEDKGFEYCSFYGNWVGEFQEENARIGHLGYHRYSNTGSSGDFTNPFFYIKQIKASHDQGDVYGFNLIYSGNHLEEVEMDSFGLIRIQQGISPLLLTFELGEGKELSTPMCVMTYSSLGINGMRHNMHRFVKENIVPKYWAARPRPVIYNNWEGTYFNFNEAKLHDLVKRAKSLGVELFVLDDGWFGQRNDDKSSLGDWDTNKKKLPHGIKGLSDYVHKNGMKFGLWFEPEAISRQSKLFEAHPDWAIKADRDQLEGRNQLLLDLSNPDVQQFVVDFLSNMIANEGIDYIKWDYNRNMSDLPMVKTYNHDYLLGLYRILESLNERFPELLMENCASGGARNDLGMFCYFNQGWVSDDTDSFERAKIQKAMSIGYPQSVMSNHVSAKTNHQMLRKTSFGTKFDVACIGALGYELHLGDLDPIDEKEIKSQIEFYKKHRETLTFGEYDVLEDFSDGNRLIVEVHDENKAFISYVNFLQNTHPCLETLPVNGLVADALYDYEVRKEHIELTKFGGLVNMLTPIHIKEEGKIIHFLNRHKGMDSEEFKGICTGEGLMAGGLKLSPQWGATGLGKETRVLGDFGARLYIFTKKE